MSIVGLQLGDHVCVPFDDDQSLEASAACATAGLRAGCQVLVYTAARPVDELADRLSANRRHAGILDAESMVVVRETADG